MRATLPLITAGNVARIRGKRDASNIAQDRCSQAVVTRRQTAAGPKLCPACPCPARAEGRARHTHPCLTRNSTEQRYSSRDVLDATEAAASRATSASPALEGSSPGLM